MKKMRFVAPYYEVEITLVQVEGVGDTDAITKVCHDFKIEEEWAEEIKGCVSRDAVNGGNTFRCLNRYKILVVFYRMTSEKILRNRYCHEKRHVEDRILNWAGVDDIEAAAFLAGFLGEKFYEFELICKK